MDITQIKTTTDTVLRDRFARLSLAVLAAEAELQAIDHELDFRALCETEQPAGHYHDPAGRYDYCDDPTCERNGSLAVELARSYAAFTEYYHTRQGARP